jgi:hypothetical protein
MRIGGQEIRKLRNILRRNPFRQHIYGIMLYVWDGNHHLKTWMGYIIDNHPSDHEWHFCVKTMVLNACTSKIIATCGIILLK